MPRKIVEQNPQRLIQITDKSPHLKPEPISLRRQTGLEQMITNTNYLEYSFESYYTSKCMMTLAHRTYEKLDIDKLQKRGTSLYR